jgi:Zn-dependent protease
VVRRIDLFLFGGLTEMSRDAASPGEDFKIAAAGPLATFGFVLLCLAVDLAIVGPHRLIHAAKLDGTVQITPVLLSLSWLLIWNVLLLAFNLVPAFPLDGGRMTRAIVWRVTGEKQRGTRAAAKLGQGFALLLAGLGIWMVLATRDLTGLWLTAIAFLLYQSARAALVQTALSARIEGVRVADIMDRQPVAIPSRVAVGDALDQFFLRYGWSWFPVIDDVGRFLGIARQERVQSAQDRGEAWLTVEAVLEPELDAAWRVREDRPITELLSSESLGRLGALMAVDGEGVLRGVVTVEQVRRALQAAFGSSFTQRA